MRARHIVDVVFLSTSMIRGISRKLVFERLAAEAVQAAAAGQGTSNTSEGTSGSAAAATVIVAVVLVVAALRRRISLAGRRAGVHARTAGGRIALTRRRRTVHARAARRRVALARGRRAIHGLLAWGRISHVVAGRGITAVGGLRGLRTAAICGRLFAGLGHFAGCGRGGGWLGLGGRRVAIVRRNACRRRR